MLTTCKFLSTPSARRATDFQREWSPEIDISIHALREEGDESWSAASEAIFKFLSTPSARRATMFGRPVRSPYAYFYPRPPRGGRRV